MKKIESKFVDSYSFGIFDIDDEPLPSLHYFTKHNEIEDEMIDLIDKKRELNKNNKKGLFD